MQGVLKELSRILARLPGLGSRSARRIAITIAQNRHDLIPMLIGLLTRVKDNLKECKICSNLSETSECYICTNYHRKTDQICIVSEVTDLWAIERAGHYEGVYHVLGGVLSITNAIGPDELNFNKLEERLQNSEVQECIIAMNPTLQGQTTVHYLQEILKKYKDVKISTLALGLPMGGELDYLDDGTIAMAIAARKELN